MKRLNIDYSWQDNALCKGMSAESYSAFYVSTGKSAAKETGGICLSCPVQDKCFNYALQYEEYGFWANTTAAERVSIRKNLGIELINIDHEFAIMSQEESIENEALQ